MRKWRRTVEAGCSDPAIDGELKIGAREGAIDELPEDYRTVLPPARRRRVSNPEIARPLQVKLGTIKSRVHGRALPAARLAVTFSGSSARLKGRRVPRMGEEGSDSAGRGAPTHWFSSWPAALNGPYRFGELELGSGHAFWHCADVAPMRHPPPATINKGVMRNAAILRSWLFVFRWPLP